MLFRQGLAYDPENHGYHQAGAKDKQKGPDGREGRQTDINFQQTQYPQHQKNTAKAVQCDQKNGKAGFSIYFSLFILKYAYAQITIDIYHRTVHSRCIESLSDVALPIHSDDTAVTPHFL